MNIKELEKELEVQSKFIGVLERQIVLLQRGLDITLKLVNSQMDFAANEAAKLRQHDAEHIDKLRDYVRMKENGKHKDLDLMIIKLKEGIGSYQGGMDYKQVKEAFSLEAAMQAYRLMYYAHETYPQDFTLHKNKGYRNGKLILRQRKDVQTSGICRNY